MRSLGTIVLIAGLAAMGYAFFMDTSVSVRDNAPPVLGSFIPANMRVNNTGLMQRRQNFLIGGGVLAVIGTILLVATGTARRKE